MSFESKIILFGALLFVLGIPLALKWVPQNPIYGVRTSNTYSNREVWYAANRSAGIDVAIAGIAIAIAALVVPRAVPDYSEGVRVLIMHNRACCHDRAARLVWQIRRL
jgi:hypothetical protein